LSYCIQNNMVHSDKKIKVLFVCVHNSARSQMAEEYLRRVGKELFEVESAGFEPTSVNPLVIAAMEEDGFDLSTKKTQAVWNLFREGKYYNYVITVCDRTHEKECPIFPKPFVQLKWSFPDPESFFGTDSEKMEQIRALRDDIRTRIEQFVEEITRSSQIDA